MGDFFELFGLKSVKSAPHPQVMSGPMGELRRAAAHLFFNGF
jgi:hypothetical protein